jgi:hypothetical protein
MAARRAWGQSSTAATTAGTPRCPARARGTAATGSPPREPVEQLDRQTPRRASRQRHEVRCRVRLTACLLGAQRREPRRAASQPGGQLGQPRRCVLRRNQQGHPGQVTERVEEDGQALVAIEVPRVENDLGGGREAELPSRVSPLILAQRCRDPPRDGQGVDHPMPERGEALRQHRRDGRDGARAGDGEAIDGTAHTRRSLTPARGEVRRELGPQRRVRDEEHGAPRCARGERGLDVMRDHQGKARRVAGRRHGEAHVVQHLDERGARSQRAIDREARSPQMHERGGDVLECAVRIGEERRMPSPLDERLEHRADGGLRTLVAGKRKRRDMQRVERHRHRMRTSSPPNAMRPAAGGSK